MLDDRLHRLEDRLRGLDTVLIAFSGGVDSSFLLAVAARVLAGRVSALTTCSPTAPEEDSALALALAAELGVHHIVVDHDELQIPGYAENRPDRCYLCKGSLYEICREHARRLGITAIADGVNADDLLDFRPGLRAAEEHGVLHPLAEVGLDKAAIRILSRKLGLPTWDRPASPCLSSRFPYGTRITLEALRRVGAAERVLHRLGFPECRVRFHDPVARIEVPGDRLSELVDEGVRRTVVEELRKLGFTFVAVDLAGFRSGSLNEALPAAAATTRPTQDRPAS